MNERYLINNICEVGSSKRIYLSEYQDSGVPFYRGKEIIEKDSNKDISNELFISQDRYDEIKSKFGVPAVGDILMTAVGTIGISWYVNETNFYFKDGNLIWFKNFNKDIINSKYLYYLFKSKLFSEIIKNISIGSTQKAITIEQVKKIELNLPKIEIQTKIVKMLDNIDRKIKLNNEINNNLFDLLKQEFREKFYNKAEKNSYLIDYISETIGGDWGKENPEGNNNTKVYCVRGADIPSMEYGNKGNAPTRYILEKNYKNKKLDPNNIIIEISGGSPTQSTGRTAYITKSILDMYDSPLLCTNFCRAVEAKSDILAPFIYMNLKLMYEDDIFFNWENGTTGIKNLALNDMLSNLEVKSPNEMELKDYYLLFNNIMNKISSNSNENIKLEQLRDTLLPKLMSGEIDLDNVEI